METDAKLDTALITTMPDLLEEYAAYRIFNVLTDRGYRARLMRVVYEDSEGGDRNSSLQYAFFLESAAQLQRRLEARRVRTKGITLSSLDQDHAALVFVFQYLIANTDWSLVTMQDIFVFQKRGKECSTPLVAAQPGCMLLTVAPSAKQPASMSSFQSSIARTTSGSVYDASPAISLARYSAPRA